MRTKQHESGGVTVSDVAIKIRCRKSAEASDNRNKLGLAKPSDKRHEFGLDLSGD